MEDVSLDVLALICLFPLPLFFLFFFISVKNNVSPSEGGDGPDGDKFAAKIEEKVGPMLMVLILSWERVFCNFGALVEKIGIEEIEAEWDCSTISWGETTTMSLELRWEEPATLEFELAGEALDPFGGALEELFEEPLKVESLGECEGEGERDDVPVPGIGRLPVITGGTFEKGLGIWLNVIAGDWGVEIVIEREEVAVA